MNGDVIVDSYPEYPPITPQESDANIISTAFKSIFGNFASKIQGGGPIFEENGLVTCFTIPHFQQAISSVIPGETLCILDFSDNILPIQAEFENKEGKATCTERDFIKKTSEDESNHLMFLRRIKIM